MPISVYVRERIVRLHRKNKTAHEITRQLEQEDGLRISYKTVLRTIRNYLRRGTWAYAKKTGRPAVLASRVSRIIDSQMRRDNECTALKLKRIIDAKLRAIGQSISVPSVNRLRRKLGWVYSSTRYCQMIREENKPKRVAFCTSLKRNFAKLRYLVFTDECSVQLERYKRKSFRMKDEKAIVLCAKAKHPVKVHVWAGISYYGATQLCVFNGNERMNSILFCRILRRNYLPFLRCQRRYRIPCVLAMDNDPKHTSRYTRNWLQNNGVRKIRWPAESPDLNPIELVWHQLKEYLRSVVKPVNKEELTDGIKQFWSTKMTKAQCAKYVCHVPKAAAAVLAQNGGPSGM